MATFKTSSSVWANVRNTTGNLGSQQDTAVACYTLNYRSCFLSVLSGTLCAVLWRCRVTGNEHDAMKLTVTAGRLLSELVGACSGIQKKKKQKRCIRGTLGRTTDMGAGCQLNSVFKKRVLYKVWEQPIETQTIIGW